MGRLRRHVAEARAYNLRHPNKPFNTRLLKNYGMLDKSTLLNTYAMKNEKVDRPVHLQPVKGWKAPLRQYAVRKCKQKPSMRGLSKSQIKKLKKRQKMKKM